ncbi:MAG: tRNA (N(6)-L-threonylcarbamoyladenosine(37)-C(2))-methylthiotransferase MtaB [Eubacterium sp.]|nr:tRNA (N(6)-L-threonylcarbamoyladenosine(37)-C(2))-methylthiotransferase MtaB [Eubacterium sp.]
MYSNLKGKKILLYTLGCKVNQYESDAMLEALLAEGCVQSDATDATEPVSGQADICIINTCSVTNMADRKSRQIIHRLRKQNPDAVIAATGCYVQIAGDSLLEDGAIDLIIGNNRKKDVARILDEYISTGKVSDYYIDVNKENEFENLIIDKPETHTRAYVKIQDGCNEFCSYCIIPYARGRIKSKKLMDITAEVDTLAKNGTKEIILTGINVSAYEDSGLGLKDVIKRLSKIEGIQRIRLSSMDPRIVTKEFLDTVSKLPQFCPHFHLSLQSACNKTLKAMNRKYTIEEYKAACELIRSYFDRPAITTDVIVGFPGETDEDFKETYKNLEELNLYEMHIFKYSRRKGTVADKMPNQVDERVKTSRSNDLLELTANNKRKFEESFKGEAQNVLIEEVVEIKGKKYYRGHTERYVLVDIPVDALPPADSENEYINMIIKYTL